MTLDEHMLAVVITAFWSSPIWTKTDFVVRQVYKQVGKKAVAKGPRTELPDDPFSCFAVIPENPESETAAQRIYTPLGDTLAMHARGYGANGPDGLRLSLERMDADGQPAIKVTVSKVKDA